MAKTDTPDPAESRGEKTMNDENHDIRSTVREFLIREFLGEKGSVELTDATPLITGGILDSISTVRLVTYLESTYGVRLRLQDIRIDRFNTVAEIVQTVSHKLAESTRS